MVTEELLIMLLPLIRDIDKTSCHICAVVALLFTQAVSTGGSYCSVRPDPFAADTIETSLGAVFYIDIKNPFTCYGIVSHFKFCYKNKLAALSDTVYIGVYRPNSDGDRYMRVGYNSIRIKPLLKKDCLTVPASPQIVVDRGYVLAFYVTFAYIKLYDDPTHGYLYKSAAFPSSIGTGALIRTSEPYSPKLEAIIRNLGPQPGNTSSSQPPLPPLPTPTSPPTLLPLPTAANTSGIPYPDISPSHQCVMGVQEVFVTSYNTSCLPFLNHGLPATCRGMVNRWELCYRGSEQSSSIVLGVWRPQADEAFTLLGKDEFVLEPEPAHENGMFVCAVFQANISEHVQPGDVVGFISTNISIAFSDIDIEPNNAANISSASSIIGLVRAIIDLPQSVLPNATISMATATSHSYWHSKLTSGTPTPRPPASINKSSTTTAIILGTLFGVLVMGVCVGFLLVVGIMLWRNHDFGKLTPRILVISDQPMVYNLSYSPHDSKQVRGRRETLDTKENPCYSCESADDVDDKEFNHTYELL